MGTFEARADEQSLVASLQCSCTKGKWYFETVVGPHARNCRTGACCSTRSIVKLSSNFQGRVLLRLADFANL